MFRVIIYSLVLIYAFFIQTDKAHAIPSADFRYIETNLGGGMWRYDYTLFNTSDQISDIGYDAYDVFLYLVPSATLTVNSIPYGWDSIGGSGGFFEAYSYMPGALPTGADVPPNTALAGFSFNLDYQGGMLPFDIMLINPTDAFNPLMISGITSPDSSPVPEPSTIILFGVGISGVLLYRKKLSIANK